MPRKTEQGIFLTVNVKATADFFSPFLFSEVIIEFV